MGITNEQQLDFMKRVIAGLAQMFGSNCETVITMHNNVHNTIVAIHNGQITKRKSGDMASQLSIQKAKMKDIDRDLINFTVKTPDGHLLKCANFHITMDGTTYALGINYDYTAFAFANGILEEFIKTETEKNDIFCSNPTAMLETMANQCLKEIGKPIAMLNKADRLQIISQLNEQGAFLIQKAAVYLADFLNVSRCTIYNYLREIEKTTGDHC
ncbi:MAG: PAS domain-containing protein [Clostridiales bacterium]